MRRLSPEELSDSSDGLDEQYGESGSVRGGGRGRIGDLFPNLCGGVWVDDIGYRYSGWR